MIEVDTTAALAAMTGKTFGPGPWMAVDQARIEAFADATGDHQWIHLDAERAARELPGGHTIAHGYLTLSLLPLLSAGLFRIAGKGRGINYGSDRVRFLAPVPSGARVRLRAVLRSAEPVEGGHRFLFENTVEIEGSAKPALVADVVTLIFDAPPPG